MPALTAKRCWAAAGAVYVALTVFVWARWLTSGNVFQRRAVDQPQWRVVLARALEIGMVGATLIAIYLLLVRPWIRRREITTDGLLVIVFLQMYMLQDTWVNYGGPLFHFNPVFFNLGCPQCYVPGFQGPHGEAEPLLFIWGMYVPVLLGACIACGWLLDRVRPRRPVLLVIALFVVIDVVIEVPYLRSGLMSYPGARQLTLWSGHSYAYPVFEVVLWGVTWAGFALLRYFVKDAGLLALLGMFNTLYLAYGLAMLPFAP